VSLDCAEGDGRVMRRFDLLACLTEYRNIAREYMPTSMFASCPIDTPFPTGRLRNSYIARALLSNPP
jgi:hypothetical protein